MGTYGAVLLCPHESCPLFPFRAGDSRDEPATPLQMKLISITDDYVGRKSMLNNQNKEPNYRPASTKPLDDAIDDRYITLPDKLHKGRKTSIHAE